jgi:(2Fe-2S) ferredoxin
MVYSDNYSRGEFNFEGQFLGFVNHDGKLKYLRLRVLSEEMQIKIPKALRIAVGLSLQLGESIRVTGISKLDRHAHEPKLKATQIIPLTDSCTQIVPETPSTPLSSVTDESKIKPKIKVLICQKSGCLKKGGKGLCEALEQILRDRNLKQYVTIQRTGCVKRCSAAPNLAIVPGNQRYKKVSHKTLPQVADAIAQSLILDPVD